MCTVFLFCVAEEAKTVQDFHSTERIHSFYIVKSSKGPDKARDINQVQANNEDFENEDFETDFIGASEQDCCEWVHEKQFQNNLIEQNFIAIADKRSASDDTLSVRYYSQGPNDEFPKLENKWYDFRINYKETDKVHSALLYVAPDCTYPVYFGMKDELTDERGVFNVAKAEETVKAQVTPRPW